MAAQPENYLFNNLCFEVLGFDIFLDHQLKPFLIEVNHTPSFATETPLDSTIKKNLIENSLRMLNLNLNSRN